MSAVKIIPDMPEEQYHASTAFSSTGAKRILKSPAVFDWWRKHPEPPKAEFDLGHAVHSRVLGVGAQVVAYPAKVLATNGAASTNAAKAWAAEQRAAGLIPVKQDVADNVSRMAEAVLKSKTARAFLEQEGTPEASVFATDPETGIELRARFDFLPTGSARRRVAVDLKTATDASKGGFERAVARLRYDVQDAHYRHAIGIDPEWEELEFVFVAVESDPPHHVLVSHLNADFAHMGKTDAARARRLYAECLQTDTWPGYPDEVVSLQPPMFAVYDFQDAHDD